jgi:hypothetical protein
VPAPSQKREESGISASAAGGVSTCQPSDLRSCRLLQRKNWIPVKTASLLISFACVSIISGCAGHIPPPEELRIARQAYAHASVSPAALLAPADLHSARDALARAEKSFREDPTSRRTKGLAYLASQEAAALEISRFDTLHTENLSVADKTIVTPEIGERHKK